MSNKNDLVIDSKYLTMTRLSGKLSYRRYVYRKDIDLRKIYKVNLVSVKRVETEIDELGNPEKKEKVFTPEPDDRLKADDRLVILGRENNIQSLKEK